VTSESVQGYFGGGAVGLLYCHVIVALIYFIEFSVNCLSLNVVLSICLSAACLRVCPSGSTTLSVSMAHVSTCVTVTVCVLSLSLSVFNYLFIKQDNNKNAKVI
jgi:hypothetical protein